VYLPMEIFHREYPGKLALALALVEMGNKVHIGYNHFIRNMALESNRGGVYFEIKGKSPKGMDYLSKIRERGVLLVGQDEEAGISYLNFNDFVLNRPEVSGVGFMDKFFAWGLDDFEYYSSHFNGQSEIKQTGSARSLFWGESGKKFYQDEIQVTQNTFGKYILIITNLASRNNLMSKRQMKKFTSNAGYGKDFYKAYSKRQTWENLAYPRIVELINRVTRDTNLKVILRPHPSEDVVQWNSEFANNKKVIISKIGNVAPLIFAADHVIHAGSTVGLEAMLSGISTISYQDIVAYEDYPMTANYYSSKASSITNLVDMLNSNESYLPLAGFANVISNKLTAANNMTLVREMASAINSSQAKSRNYSQEKDLTLTEVRKESFLHRMVDRVQYGKSAYSDIHSHKRPKLSTVQVTKDFHRLSRIIDSNLEVGISEIGESSFTISKHY
jgi:surface carbohydrate biosynthesis protein